MVINSNYNIENADTQHLSDWEIDNLYEIEQDMWARWFWEFVQCKNCNSVYSKKEIFWNYPKDLQHQTVMKIMNILNISSISCKICHHETQLMYDLDYKKEMKQRYQNPLSFLKLFKDKQNQILGFADWYFSDLKTIYQQELQCNFGKIWYETIKQSITSQTWNQHNIFLDVSSVGFVEKYSNLTNFFVLLWSFLADIPNEYKNIPVLIEVNEHSHICLIYKKLWAKKIFIDQNNKIENLHKDIDMSLYILENPFEIIESGILTSIKSILKWVKSA